MKVWVVVADYGLNGAGVLGVFDREPSARECDLLSLQPVDPAIPDGPSHRSVTGWQCWTVEEWEVKS